MSRAFECYVGGCVRCCTEPPLQLVITISDIYRTWVYRNIVEDKKAGFYRVYQLLTKGWTVAPDISQPNQLLKSSSYRPVASLPLSRMPCTHVDTVRKECKGHGKYQYVGCGLFPEDWLLPTPPDFYETPRMRSFVDSVDCLKEVSLSPERVETLRRMRELWQDELYITVMTINHPFQPALINKHRASLQAAIPEFERRLRYIGTENGMTQLWPNISQTMERYVDLFVDDPEVGELYTKPTWRKIMRTMSGPKTRRKDKKRNR